MRSKIRNLINDIDFEKIELELKSLNIFEILNITHAEIRHSYFLTWLFDPNGNHGLGSIFLKKFLRDIFENSDNASVDIIDADLLDYSNVTILREWRKIDILIIFNDIVICIENKVESQEHTQQLERYKHIVEESFKSKKNKFYIYLTPYGNDPISDFGKKNYINWSYTRIIEIISSVIELHRNQITDVVYYYILDYLKILRRYLMGNDEINKLAQRVYLTHKQALDFIFENKPDILDDFGKVFNDLILKKGWVLASPNKGYVRFTTKKLDALIPKKGGWPQKELFLFELEFYSQERLLFKAAISPTDDNDLKTILDKTISSVEGIKPHRAYAKKWFTYINKTWDIDFNNLWQKEDKEIESALDKCFPEIAVWVNKIEQALIKIQDKIK